MKQCELRLTGSGGQGIILLGVILADAAIIDGKNAIQSQSYGPEARGGASKAEVIISSEEIDYPKVQTPTYLLCLNQVAMDKYIGDITDSTKVILDSEIEMDADPKYEYYSLPILATARDILKKPITGNIVALGAIAGLTNLASKESVLKAVLKRVPKGTEELNKKALEEGYRLAKEAK